MSNAVVVLSDMQKAVRDLIVEWFDDSSSYSRRRDSFVLAGYAGTGKTTIMHEVVKELGLDKDEVVFATFTGKASLVLRNKLPKEFVAITLHKLLYEVSEENGQVSFTLKHKSLLSHIKLIVVDECSMVSEDLLRDLMTFGIKVLFVGDHGQLPPVGAKSDIYNRLNNNPDGVLTEIHRQAEGNPIIYLSMLARQGKPIPYGNYGDKVKVVPKSEIRDRYWKSVMNADQVICGLNKTRHWLNNAMRNSLGFTSPMPVVGDKMICLRNNWSGGNDEVPLVNGLIGTIDKIKPQYKKIQKISMYRGRRRVTEYRDKRPSMKLTITPDFSEKPIHGIDVLNGDFEGVTQNHDDFRHYDSFDFGYAITAHKSQGSEWDKVFVISEVLNRADHHRWLYTAITRASDCLILAI